jgi:hypothetical protein
MKIFANDRFFAGARRTQREEIVPFPAYANAKLDSANRSRLANYAGEIL